MLLATMTDLTNHTLLDIGAGDGSIGAIAAPKFGLGKVTLYDVQQTSNSWGDVQLFDGQHVPEPDGSHDLVMLAYVLHHAAEKQLQLLREARRVAHLLCEPNVAV